MEAGLMRPKGYLSTAELDPTEVTESGRVYLRTDKGNQLVLVRKAKQSELVSFVNGFRRKAAGRAQVGPGAGSALGGPQG
jgi:hypothetical protein